MKNREIKFRAWNKNKNKMICGGNNKNGSHMVLSLTPDFWSIYDAANNSKTEVTDVTGILIQFTGLNDKNGKEIYEGDIVLIEGSKKIVEFDKHEAGQTWGHGEYGYTLNVGFSFSAHQPIESIIEIIGNIYENPELI